MGYTAAESHVHADELGDTFSDDMVERINERLGFPYRCPHWAGRSRRTSSRPRTRSSSSLAELPLVEPSAEDRTTRRARRRPTPLVLRERLHSRREGAAPCDRGARHPRGGRRRLRRHDRGEPGAGALRATRRVTKRCQGKTPSVLSGAHALILSWTEKGDRWG